MEHFVVSQVSGHAYLAIFVLMVLESACIPIPSEAIIRKPNQPVAPGLAE